jgi:hypothetical protein
VLLRVRRRQCPLHRLNAFAQDADCVQRGLLLLRILLKQARFFSPQLIYQGLHLFTGLPVARQFLVKGKRNSTGCIVRARRFDQYFLNHPECRVGFIGPIVGHLEFFFWNTAHNSVQFMRLGFLCYFKQLLAVVVCHFEGIFEFRYLILLPLKNELFCLGRFLQLLVVGAEFLDRLGFLLHDALEVESFEL